MLIIKAYINHKEIDEIMIQNTGICTHEELQEYEYKIVKPKGYSEYAIFHIRERGWRSLVSKAIDVIENYPTR